MSAEDPAKLGSMAVARGWLTREQLAECLELQKSRSGGAPRAGLLGEILLEKNYLTPERLQWLLLHQERYIIECPHCKARLLAPELPPGTKTHCTKCKKGMVLAGPGQPPRPTDDPAPPPAPPSPPGDPMIGREIGGYRVEGKLGAGGMGIVYKARQIALDRTVALKFLKADGDAAPDFIERFKREAQAAARLNHANIIQVHDAGHEGGTLFFSMEFVEGETLSSILDRQGRIPPTKALRIVREVAKALAYAHGHGVIHRDIKPDNILLTKDGHVKLADLGLAKVKDVGDAHKSLTLSGEVMGTPYYMSPEQTKDTRSVDARSDVYSLGATFYRMVTGEPPFPGESPFEVMAKIQRGPAPNANERFPDVPWVFGQLIAKMMAQEPADRFQSAAEFLSHSENIEHSTTFQGQTRIAGKASRAPPGIPARTALAAAVLGGIALAAVGFTVGRASAPRPAPVRPSAAEPPPAQADAPAQAVPQEPLPAPSLDPAEAYLKLVKGFRDDRPRDTLAQKTLVRRALQDSLLDKEAPFGKRLSEIADEIRREEETLERERALIARMEERVDALAAAGDFGKALDAEALSRAFPGAAALPAYADFLAALPARVERAANADYRAVLETLLREKIPASDHAGAVALLEAAAGRYVPFPALRIEAESLLRNADLWFSSPSPEEQPAARPPPDEPGSPPDDKPDKSPRRKKLKKRVYFSSKTDLKEWDMESPGGPGGQTQLRVENMGVSYKLPHGMPPPPDKKGSFGMKPLFYPPLKLRDAMVGPARIQFLWTPRSREDASLRVFLCEPDQEEMPRPILEIGSSSDGLWCFSPLLNAGFMPERTILEPSAGGYRVLIEIPDKEDRDPVFRITLTPESKKKGAKTLEFRSPEPGYLSGQTRFGVMLAPEDVLSQVELHARDFED